MLTNQTQTTISPATTLGFVEGGVGPKTELLKGFRWASQQRPITLFRTLLRRRMPGSWAQAPNVHTCQNRVMNQNYTFTSFVPKFPVRSNTNSISSRTRITRDTYEHHSHKFDSLLNEMLETRLTLTSDVLLFAVDLDEDEVVGFGFVHFVTCFVDCCNDEDGEWSFSTRKFSVQVSLLRFLPFPWIFFFPAMPHIL